MSPQISPEEEKKRAERAALVTEFRSLLAERWPERPSMETLLEEAGLETSYIVDMPKPVERWAQTLKEIDSDTRLLSLVLAVRNRYKVRIPVVEKLCALEEIRRKDQDEMDRRALAVGTFTRLVGSMGFTTDHVRRLRKPEHPDRKVLAQLNDRLNGLYELLDELRATQRGFTTRPDEAVQAQDIEEHANRCTDALLFYTTLLEYARPDDNPIQIDGAEPPGRLVDRARDERVLIAAKARLRDALVRLGDQTAEFNSISVPPPTQQ